MNPLTRMGPSSFPPPSMEDGEKDKYETSGKSTLPEDTEGYNFRTETSERLTGSFINKNIVNLSKRALNKAEISLLSKGLKFVPTPT